VATVGLTETEAREAGHALKIYRATFRPLRHTLTAMNTKAMLKLVVDKGNDKVLGCHMVGEDAPEIMQGFAAALSAGASKADLNRTIAIHPTVAEEFVTMRTPVQED
jgi:glutathione reductase (NADPH)